MHTRAREQEQGPGRELSSWRTAPQAPSPPRENHRRRLILSVSTELRQPGLCGGGAPPSRLTDERVRDSPSQVPVPSPQPRQQRCDLLSPSQLIPAPQPSRRPANDQPHAVVSSSERPTEPYLVGPTHGRVGIEQPGRRPHLTPHPPNPSSAEQTC